MNGMFVYSVILPADSLKVGKGKVGKGTAHTTF